MYCRRPFEQFYVAENGDVHLCCPEWIAMPAGNVLATPPLEIWHGKVAQRIRDSIDDQSFRFCTRCPFLPGPDGCVTIERQPDVSVNRIHTLTVAYDPTCNLSCPSCRNNVKGKAPRSQQIQDILIESGIFYQVDRLCSSGDGDPIASPLFWDLLEKLPADRYPRLRLVLQTNGVLLNKQAWDRLGAYAPRVNEILISIDAGTETTYLKNRRGGNMEDLLDNLVEIKARKVPLQLNMVVQQNNYQEMIKLVQLANAAGAHRIYFSALDNWGSYSVADYLNRAVHLPGHPEHHDLLKMLADPILHTSNITLARLPKP